MAIYNGQKEAFDHTYSNVNIFFNTYRIIVYGDQEYIFLKVQSIQKSIHIHSKRMIL